MYIRTKSSVNNCASSCGAQATILRSKQKDYAKLHYTFEVTDRTTKFSCYDLYTNYNQGVLVNLFHELSRLSTRYIITFAEHHSVIQLQQNR